MITRKNFCTSYVVTTSLGFGLIVVGQYLPTTSFWGMNHTAYIDAKAPLLLALAAIAILAPPAMDRIAEMADAGDNRRAIWAMQTAAFCTLVLVSVFMRQRTFFMGDGYLLLDLIDKGVSFRILDNMDYAFHFALAGLLERFGYGPRLSYIITSIIAIGALVFGIGPLVGKLQWEAWRRIGAAILILGSGSLELLMGYVESYTLLYVCIVGYTVAGLLVVQGRQALWVASSLLGAAVFFHLSALLAVPSLMILLWARSDSLLPKRLVAAFGPVLLGLVISFAVHLSLGYGPQWFEREILGEHNMRSALVSLHGPNGIFSSYGILSQLNVALILYPVAGIVVLFGFRRLYKMRRQPQVLFLFVLVICYAAASLLLNKHLGAARDWDLLASHSSCIALLAVLSLRSGEQLRGRVIQMAVVTVMVTIPWVAVNASPNGSVSRFEDVVTGFPPYARGYAYEGLGQYYREKGDLASAVENYEKSVSASPGNARFHSLLGTAYVNIVESTPQQSEAYLQLAEGAYRRAIELGYSHQDAYRGLVYVLLRQGQYAEAIPRIIDLLNRWHGTEKDWTALMRCYKKARLSPSNDVATKLIGMGPPEPIRNELELHLNSISR